jgi:hypothetical protein
MATSPNHLEGDALLVTVTDAMVALHERYYHRPPGSPKTRMMSDDLVACVLGGVYTDVERSPVLHVISSHNIGPEVELFFSPRRRRGCGSCEPDSFTRDSTTRHAQRRAAARSR